MLQQINDRTSFWKRTVIEDTPDMSHICMSLGRTIASNLSFQKELQGKFEKLMHYFQSRYIKAFKGDYANSSHSIRRMMILLLTRDTMEGS